MRKVSIWGCGGFVGGACYETFSKLKSLNFQILGYDIVKEKSKNSKQQCLDADLHFVCVPTPMKKTGECYIDIVKNVVNEIIVNTTKKNPWIVVKSTVPIGFCSSLIQEFSYKNICFNPEFLTEANSLKDFQELQYQIIGVDGEAHFWETCSLVDLYQQCFSEQLMKNEMFLTVSTKEAEMIKLVRNCFLATRLSFFNEMYQVSSKFGINYDSMVELVGLDDRVGMHYNKVPGPDGDFGWGLSCFPKDINNLRSLMKNAGIKSTVLDAVWSKNLEVRTNKDWENLEKAFIK
jgi:UDPglucose 6-dehydrogenase